MGDSKKLRFYELDHDESNMRLLKTHTHTSNGLAMEPGKREEKQLVEGKADSTTRQTSIKNLSRVSPVRRGVGGQKRLYGKQTTEKAPCIARQTFVERKGNAGADTRENSCQKPPAARPYVNTDACYDK